jgi:hypothetical protein
VTLDADGKWKVEREHGAEVGSYEDEEEALADATNQSPDPGRKRLVDVSERLSCARIRFAELPHPSSSSAK